MGQRRSLAVHALSDLTHERGGNGGQAFVSRAVFDHVLNDTARELRYTAEYLVCLIRPIDRRRGLLHLRDKLARRDEDMAGKLTQAVLNCRADVETGCCVGPGPAEDGHECGDFPGVFYYFVRRLP